MPERNVIGLVGYKGSGKDTVADIIARRYGFQKKPFAEPLKKTLMLVFGLTEAELNDPILKEQPLDRWPFESPRTLMQKVGTDLLRERYPGVWIEAWKHGIAAIPRVVASDVRFLDEAAAVRQLGGLIIRVERPGRIRSDTHASETEQLYVKHDLLIMNDGDFAALDAQIEHLFGTEFDGTFPALAENVAGARAFETVCRSWMDRPA